VKRTAAVVLACLCATATANTQETGGVSGIVVADDGGRPLGGVKVLIASPARETTTSADGRFAFGSLAPGSILIVFTHPDRVTLSEPAVVEAGRTVTLTVRLPAAPTLHEELTVVGRLSDYVEASAAASKTSARLIDVPQAIVVLPSQFLEDLGALDTKDLYRHISGVEDSPYSSTVVRGFTQREVLVNGVRGNPYGSLDGDVNNSGFSTSQFRLTNVERVEVLKGPSSVLYGSGEPGGVINYVTRKPRETFGARATVGTGQYSQTLAEAEVTGPANASRTLLYRGAAYVEDRDSFRFNANIQNVHAVGGLSWKRSARSMIGFEYEYIDQTNDGHRLRGVPVDAQGTYLADYRWTATEPNDFTDLNAHVAQVHVDQALGPAMRLDSTLRYAGYDRRENYHEPRGITGAVMQREFRDQLRTNDDWSWGVTLSAPIRSGAAARHDLAIGADVVRQDHLFRFATARQQNTGGPVPPLSLASPVYGAVDPSTYGLTPDRFSTDTAVTTRTGVYAQDLVSIGPRWNVLAGGRWDRYDDTGASGGLALAADHSAVTGRLGVVFKLRPSLSIYGSVANGFSRASILSQTPSANGPHDPETTRQIEVGAKSEWLEGRVQLTAAFFDARKENVLRPDPALGPSGTNFNAVLATGEVRNRGVEIDLAGALTPRWNLAFNYAYLDSEITRDLVASLVGRSMPNAPPHAAGFFTRIDLPRGAAVGGSVEYVDDRIEPFAGIRAPAYTVVDAHYFQQITSRLRLLVRVENLFDREYAASSLFAARAGNMPGQPRTASIALTITSRRAAAAPAP
jgi:iron complex outermembrane recepter protein